MSRTPFLFLDVIPGQDRTAQLQSAIDSAADCGGTVALAPGEFLCGKLTLRSGVTLCGTPLWTDDTQSGTVLTLCDPCADCLLDLSGAAGAAVCGMTLRGSLLGAAVHGIFADSTSTDAERMGLRFEDVKCTEFSGDGIHLAAVRDAEMRHCLFCSNGGCGIVLHGQELTLTDTVCHANRKNGADVSGTSVNLSSARFYENGENGIAVQKADGVCIVSCGAEKNGVYGIFLQGEKERLCRGINVAGCSFRQNGTAHLFADCVCALCACHNLFSPAEENPPHALVLCRLRDAAVRCNLLTKSYALAPIENADNHRGQIALSQNIG